MHVGYGSRKKMDRISTLILKKLSSDISPEEMNELESWASQSAARRQLMERLTNLSSIAYEYERERQINIERPASDMERRVKGLCIHKRMRVFGRTAAAVALLAIGTGAYIYMDRHYGQEDTTTTPALASLSLENITPGSTGAVYHGTNGRTMLLGASDTTVLANQLEMDDSKRGDDMVTQLCLEVNRGKEFRVVLEDSTIVWLNSESVLRYPERFAEDTRRVSISGEAYFEVRPDKDRPFYVEAGNQLVRVYGTSFNIRGYRDENAVLTTLEKGSISISPKDKEDAALFLSPGHQARFDNESATVSMKEVNPEIVTGWRHGKFVFEETPLSTIMRDLSRWYDFDYEFADESLKDVVFMGSVSRYSDFRTIIRILEDGGEVKFTIERNKIIISNK